MVAVLQGDIRTLHKQCFRTIHTSWLD